MKKDIIKVTVTADYKIIEEPKVLYKSSDFMLVSPGRVVITDVKMEEEEFLGGHNID